MRIQIISILYLALSFQALATNDQDMKDLFKKYDQVMDQKKFSLIEEVFSKKFLISYGGKEKYISALKQLATPKSAVQRNLTWRKGARGEMFFAKYVDPKSKISGPEFIVVQEGGKLKIEGTVSDGE